MLGDPACCCEVKLQLWSGGAHWTHYLTRTATLPKVISMDKRGSGALLPCTGRREAKRRGAMRCDANETRLKEWGEACWYHGPGCICSL